MTRRKFSREFRIEAVRHTKRGYLSPMEFETRTMLAYLPSTKPAAGRPAAIASARVNSCANGAVHT